MNNPNAIRDVLDELRQRVGVQLAGLIGVVIGRGEHQSQARSWRWQRQALNDFLFNDQRIYRQRVDDAERVLLRNDGTLLKPEAHARATLSGLQAYSVLPRGGISDDELGAMGIQVEPTYMQGNGLRCVTLPAGSEFVLDELVGKTAGSGYIRSRDGSRLLDIYCDYAMPDYRHALTGWGVVVAHENTDDNSLHRT